MAQNEGKEVAQVVLLHSYQTAQCVSAGSTAESRSTGQSVACDQGKEVAQDLLLQDCRLSGTCWQPGSMLTCSAWTLLAASLPAEPEALENIMEQADVNNLNLALQGLQRCAGQVPMGPALWPDTMLWWYLVISAKVGCRLLCKCWLNWAGFCNTAPLSLLLYSTASSVSTPLCNQCVTSKHHAKSVRLPADSPPSLHLFVG